MGPGTRTRPGRLLPHLLLAAALPVRCDDWLLNDPAVFHRRADLALLDGLGNFSQDPLAMATLTGLLERHMQTKDGSSDLEVVDALEHFFWGQAGGVAMELGAVDGTPGRSSMTYDLEHSLNWTRILVEANPKFRNALQVLNPSAFAVHAAICAEESTVHFGFKAYCSGIVEFMEFGFLRHYFPVVFQVLNSTDPPLRWDLVDWSQALRLSNERARFDPVSCLPLAKVLRRADVRHVNFFVLDVEGGELSVLRSVDWGAVKFDVICVETETRYRPSGYVDALDAFLSAKGYHLYASKGRNSWFVRDEFVPSSRPGVQHKCFRGVETLRRKSSSYQRVVAEASDDRVIQSQCSEL